MTTILNSPVVDFFHEAYPEVFQRIADFKNEGRTVTYPGPLVGESIVEWAERVRFEPVERFEPEDRWFDFAWPVASEPPPVPKEAIDDILQRIEERRAQCGGAKDLNW